MNDRFTKDRALAGVAAIALSLCFSAAMAAPAKEVPTAVPSTQTRLERQNAAAKLAYKRKDLAALTALAVQGNALAQLNLGEMYSLGSGVPKDATTAVRWYRKAASQGHSSAQYRLALMYARGEGVAEDDAAAVSWWRKAADQGDPNAPFNLGQMYEQGSGVTQDFVQAYKWFDLAAARTTNAFMRGLATKERDEVAAKMTPAQLAEAQRLTGK